MKRKLFLLLPLLTAVIFELIYFFLYRHYFVYKDELWFKFSITFSLFVEIAALFACYMFIFATEKVSKKTKTTVTIILILFTVQPFITFMCLICVIIFVGFLKALKDIVGYIENPLDEKI